ncbi:CHASE2 domain-containing protein [Roseicella sp. DB1501]|uniref:CHASE2 domain-containing protein n=1 Tax=Roseicella sp. DB1501 TaxID=2730925 RepID=UPI0014914F3B|nr:CHASE2 domain-containing protein [Roseicella sp. DB1501]NOG73797.1 CHASE2 domain-containing protein [Roseicella sp. DB1501]
MGAPSASTGLSRKRRWLFYAGLYLCFALLDPFGIDGALRLHGREFVSRTIGHLYGLSTRLGITSDRNPGTNVAVLLIDEAYVQGGDRQGLWPIAWHMHAHLLRQVLEHGPRAVFLDFVFETPRSDQDFDSLKTTLEEAKVPILLGEILRPPLPSGLTRRPCAEPRSKQQLADDRPVGRTHPDIACAARDTASIRWDAEEYASHYPLAVLSPAANGEQASSQHGADPPAAVLTPAPALYRVVFGHGASRDLAAADEDDKMLVAWQTRGSPMERARIQGTCDRTDPPFLAILGALIPRAEQHFASPSSKWIVPFEPCLPVDSITASQLEADTAEMGGPDSERPSPFAGRIVLIGSGRGEGDPDVVHMPSGAEVPGVMLHAMALDNLLRFGPDNYWGFKRTKIISEIDWSDIVSSAAMVITALLSHTWLRPVPPLAMVTFILIIFIVLLRISAVDVMITLFILSISEQFLKFMNYLHGKLEHSPERHVVARSGTPQSPAIGLRPVPGGNTDDAKLRR